MRAKPEGGDQVMARASCRRREGEGEGAVV